MQREWKGFDGLLHRRERQQDEVAEQHYDAEKEEMTMVLDHFSIHTIVDESPAGEEIPVAVLIMTAVIVLICLAILLPQVVGRKQ